MARSAAPERLILLVSARQCHILLSIFRNQNFRRQTCIENRIKEAEELCNRTGDNEAYFQMTKDAFEEREILKEKYASLAAFWNDQVFWKEKKKEWYDTPISRVDTDAISKRIYEMKDVAKNSEEIIRTKFEMNLDMP